MFLVGEGVGSTSDVVSWWRGRGEGSCSSSSTVSGVPSVTDLIMLIESSCLKVGSPSHPQRALLYVHPPSFS